MSTRNGMKNDFVEQIAAVWRRIEQWLELNASAWLNRHGREPLFNPPASGEELAELQARLHLRLPDQLKALLLTHNGCRRGEYPFPMGATRPTKWRIMPVAEMIEEWDMLCSIDVKHPFSYTVQTAGPVRAAWWSRGWIPIADCGMGDVVCVDTRPAQGGTSGQLILYEHDFEERKVLYPSILDWLKECARDLENGEYVYMDGIGLNKVDMKGSQ